MSNVKVKILSGISGSGKSTYAIKSLADLSANGDFGHIYSADNFFIVNGAYQFDKSKLSDAHAQCLKFFTQDLIWRIGNDNDGQVTLFVDNTNTTLQEIAPYYSLAAAFGAEVEVVVFNVDPEVARSRNVHNVPFSTILGQGINLNKTLRNWPKYWNKVDAPKVS